MSTTPEVEQIIRLVLERLATAGDLMAGVNQLVQSPVEELAVEERVVTLSTIEKHIEGKRRLRVLPRAVVTPAVSDLLRSKKIELVRGEVGGERATRRVDRTPFDAARRSTLGSTPVPTPLLVCGNAIWFNSLNKHLCPKQARVQGCEDGQATKLIADHLSSGGARAIWLSSTPFAASIAASSSGCCRAVLLPSLRELGDALSQANPQALIVDSPRWTVAAIGNLVRALSKSK